jgi:hypothetical protein
MRSAAAKWLSRKRLTALTGYIAVLALPGGFVVGPLALWIQRRRARPRRR